MDHAPLSPPLGAPPGDRARVLVAETDGDLRSVLSWVLGDDPRFCVVAQAADAAAVDACATTFDVAVLDLLLAGAHGLDMIDRLRRRVPAPVVVVLAEQAPIYLRHALQAAGAAGVLVKPGDLDHLGDRLSGLVPTVPTNPLDARIP